MAGKALAVDLGSHTVKVLAVRDGKGGLVIERFASVPAGEDALASAGIPLHGAVVGLAGRDMILRYSQVPPSPDWQLKNLMDLEIQDLSGQSGGELSADYNVLPIVDEEGGMETVLMALARNDALARQASVVEAAGGSVAGYVPNCIAIYNAFLRCGQIEPDAVVCLCNLGHDTMDIALVRGTDLLFARNLTGGGKVLDDAIAAAFNVSARKAEQLKKDLLDLDPQSRGRYASGQAEKVTLAAGGASSMIVSAVQSSLSFCQSQTRIKDLRLDKVLVSGGGARLRGLEGMLKEALRCTVQVFDPFASCDLSRLPQEDTVALDAARHEAVVALGLAATKCDDSLYSLEILPEAVKRKKRFFERTIFNIAAGAIAGVVLALLAVTWKERQGDAQLKAQLIARQKSAKLSTDEQAKKLLEENEGKRELVATLAEKAVPLDGTLKTLRALQATLPAELWVQTLEITRDSAMANRGTKPIVTLTGMGKELGGSPIGDVYQDFNKRFRKLVAVDDKDVKSEPVADGRTKFTFKIDFQREAAKEPK